MQVIMTFHENLQLCPKLHKSYLNKDKTLLNLIFVQSLKLKLCTLSFWTWTLKQCCRVWKMLQLLFWSFSHQGFGSVGNFTLQKGPWDFWKLQTDPSDPLPFFFFLWHPLLLCFLCRRRRTTPCRRYAAAAAPPPTFPHPHASPRHVPAVRRPSTGRPCACHDRQEHCPVASSPPPWQGPERPLLASFCGRTNLNYTGSSTWVHYWGLQHASNGIIPWPVG
jgi:hypothetical protein